MTVAGEPRRAEIPALMRPSRTVLALLAVLLALPASGVAQTVEDDAGGLIGLSLPVGARILGQGRTAVARSGDLQAAPYNPAVLARIERGAVAFSRFEAAELADLASNYVAGAWTSTWGTFAVQAVVDDFGEIVVTETSPEPVGRIDVSDWAVGVSYANTWRETVAWGVTAKWYRADLGVEDGSGPAFDAGIVYSPKADRLPLDIGVSVRNVGPDVEFEESVPVDTGAGGSETSEEHLPSEVRVGIAVHPELGLPEAYRVTLAFDIESDLRELSASSQHVGAAVVAHDVVVVRGGIVLVDNPFVESGDESTNVGGSFGIGVRYEGFEADVAREVSVSELGDETHFSVGYRF